MRDDDPRHGTPNGYGNLKCRCRRCRDAWAAHFKSYLKEWRLSNGECSVEGCTDTIYRKRDSLCRACCRRFDRRGTTDYVDSRRNHRNRAAAS